MSYDKVKILDFINNCEVRNIDNLALIDCDSILWSVCVNKKQSEEYDNIIPQKLRTFKDIIEEFESIFFNILTEANCNSYIAFLTGNSNFKKEINKEYKANRVNREYPEFFNSLKQYCLNQYNFLIVDNYEADDLINIYSEYFSFVNHKNHIIIHIDKDLDQIPGHHYNYRKKEAYYVNAEKANFLLWKQCITGDQSDNIKGIEGKGEKFADKLLLNANIIDYMNLVLNAYVDNYGEYEGISNFTKNYLSLKLHPFNNKTESLINLNKICNIKNVIQF
jgi:5'-3' exonuclease